MVKPLTIFTKNYLSEAAFKKAMDEDVWGGL